jgi:hypothetical protein
MRQNDLQDDPLYRDVTVLMWATIYSEAYNQEGDPF